MNLSALFQVRYYGGLVGVVTVEVGELVRFWIFWKESQQNMLTGWVCVTEEIKRIVGSIKVYGISH